MGKSAKNSRTKNSVINAITSIVQQLILVVLKFVTRTVFISTLGKSYLGINGLFSDILTMLSLTELGIDTAINFKLYKPLAQRDEKRVRLLMKFYRDAYRVVGIIILLLGLLLIPFLPWLINDYDSLAGLGINAVVIFFLYLLQSVSSYLFFASRSAIIKADQKDYVLNIVGYGITIATNVCQIFILIKLHDFILYTVSVIFFNILQNFINAAIAKKLYSYAFIKEDEKLTSGEIKDIFKDLSALFVYKINSVVLKATDNMVLSAFIGLEIVGMYSNYLLFYTTIKSLLNKLYDSTKASMGNLFATESIENKYRFFEVMNFITVILYGTACVGVTVVADEVIKKWIGAEYTIAQPFAMLVGIEILFLGLKNNLGQVRNVTGAFRQMWFRPVLGIIVNLVVSIATVHKLGIYGVLIGTIAADLTTNFMVDPSVIYKYSFENYRPVFDYYKKNVVYLAILTLIGAADYIICRNVFNGFGWLSIAAHMMVCGLSVPVIFFIIFRRSHECIYLMSKLKRIKSGNKK